jgi:hypothetical protein
MAYCFLLLASVLGYLHLDSRPMWAPFASEYSVNKVNQVDDLPESSESGKPSKTLKGASSVKTSPPSLHMDWLPDTAAPSVHAASLIALKDGAVRAFWFAGSREGAADVVINTAVFDPQAARWSAPSVVIDRVGAEKGLSRYIKKLGNPVPARMADGRMQLFFVTVSIGGWAGSSIWQHVFPESKSSKRPFATSQTSFQSGVWMFAYRKRLMCCRPRASMPLWSPLVQARDPLRWRVLIIQW